MSEQIFIEALRADNSSAFQNKRKFISYLQKSLSSRVESAYLFGSITGKHSNKDSDVDIILIKQTTKSFTERAVEFFDLLDLGPEMDILVYTSEEFNRLIKNPSVGFWQSVSETMVKII